MSACVVVEVSICTLYRSRPCCFWILSRIGLTAPEKRASVVSRFGSKINRLATFLTLRLISMSSRLTLTLSSADSAACKVFWPKMVGPPCPGNEVIGLILASYRTSRLERFVFSATSSATNAPLEKPAGANHGWAIASLRPKAPSTATDGGTCTLVFVVGSVTITSGKYAAAKLESRLRALNAFVV